MLRIIAIAAVVLLSGCAGKLEYDKGYRVDTPLKVKTYNSVAAAYLDRPTFVSVAPIISGPDALVVRHDPYGGGELSDKKPFIKTEVESYISIIDKWLDWDQKAVDNSDNLDLQVGSAKSLMGQPLGFSIFTANTGYNLMVVKICTFGDCSQDYATQYYDRENVVILRGLLESFAAGELKAAPSGVYE